MGGRTLADRLRGVDAAAALEVAKEANRTRILLEAIPGAPSLEALVKGKSADAIIQLGDRIESMNERATAELARFQQLPGELAFLYLDSLPSLEKHTTPEERGRYVAEMLRWEKQKGVPAVVIAESVSQALEYYPAKQLLSLLRHERLAQEYYSKRRWGDWSPKKRILLLLKTAKDLETIEEGATVALGKATKLVEFKKLNVLCKRAPKLAHICGSRIFEPYTTFIMTDDYEERGNELDTIDKNLQKLGNNAISVLRNLIRLRKEDHNLYMPNVMSMEFVHFAVQYGPRAAKQLADVMIEKKHPRVERITELADIIGWNKTRKVLADVDGKKFSYAMKIIPDEIKKVGPAAVTSWIKVSAKIGGSRYSNDRWTDGLTRLVLEDPKNGKMFSENAPAFVSTILEHTWPLEKYTSETLLAIARIIDRPNTSSTSFSNAFKAIGEAGAEFRTSNQDIMTYIRAIERIMVYRSMIGTNYADNTKKILEHGERILYEGIAIIERLAERNPEAAATLAEQYPAILACCLNPATVAELVADTQGSHRKVLKNLPNHLSELEKIDKSLVSISLPFIQKLLTHERTAHTYLWRMPEIATLDMNLISPYATAVAACLQESQGLGTFVAESSDTQQIVEEFGSKQAQALYHATAQVARQSWRTAGALFEVGAKLIGTKKLGSIVADIMEGKTSVSDICNHGANHAWIKHNRPVDIIWKNIVEGGAPREYGGWY